MTREGIAWLAGFIDGEGCYTAQVFVSMRGQLEFKPFLDIVQNDGDLRWLNKIEKIFKQHQIPYSVSHKVKNRLVKATSIYVRSIPGIKKITRMILPYLTVKRPIAKHFLKSFPEGRKIIVMREKDSISGRFTNVINHKNIDWKMIDKMCKFIDRVRILNHSKTNKAQYNLRWTGKTIREFFLKKYLKSC